MLSTTSLSTARPQAAAACMEDDDGGEKDGRAVRGDREERGQEECSDDAEKKAELAEKLGEEEDNDDEI